MTNPFAQTTCVRESEVAEAAKRGRRSPEIEAHLSTCAACREVDAAAVWMTALAADTDAMAERRRLPQPGQLWWKAQLARRLEAEKQAVAPLDMMQRVEVGVGGAAALVLLVALVRSLGVSAPAGDLVPVLAGWLEASHTGAIAVIVLLLAAGSVAALHRLLASD